LTVPVDALYRYPVRLLIVSQTVPTELHIQEQGRSWRSDHDGFAGEVLKLGGEAALGPAKVRVMANSLQLQMEAGIPPERWTLNPLSREVS